MKPHITPSYDCPRGNVYSLPDGRVVCHPRDLRLAFKVARDIVDLRRYTRAPDPDGS